MRNLLVIHPFSFVHFGLLILLIPVVMVVGGCTEAGDNKEGDNEAGNNDSVNSSQSVSWILDNTEQIGGYQPEIHGSPTVMSDPKMGDILSFDGESDGIVIPANPVEGWEKFTVEVLFWPASDAPEEQRFVHFQDEDENRGLIETRVTPDGTWTLDTYLHQGATGDGLTLIDRSIQHPTDQWYWAALTYDGKTMKHYINGVEELSGDFEFKAMGPGKISLGVRQNLVFWYKGRLKEIRFHPEALASDKLQKAS